MSYRIGIDTGGTFTDTIVVDEKGKLILTKSPTTPKDLKIGLINCIDKVAKQLRLTRNQFLGQVNSIVHGTTQGTNAIVARSGPEIGMICTEGHRDVVQLRRVVRTDNFWDWKKEFPQPLVPRYMRVEVGGRIGSKGEEVRPLDEASVHKAVAYFKKMKVRSIVVGLIFSFLNGSHERRVREIIKKDYPDVHVTLSHEVYPIVGEYERFSTAVLDAYIRPIIAEYISELEAFLDKEGFKGQLLFMQSNGGVESSDIALKWPSTMAMSGPSAAPSAALNIGKLNKQKNLLSVDMGGTSFDIAILDKGRYAVKTESVIENHRYALPVIDIETLGAGGGSIAWFDLGGTLKVGPQSATADPGPACYNLGGTEPTVTDANVILGYVNPDYILGGEIKLRRDLAEEAIKEKVADRLGLSIPEAAAAIYLISNSNMVDAVSHSFIKKGYDPRDFVLVSGGSATGLSALRIAQDIGFKQVVLPKIAPVYAPFGMLTVDLRHDFYRYHHASDKDLDLDKVKTLYKEMEQEGLPLLNKEGVPKDKREMQRTMHVRYWGQFRDIEVPWPNGLITKKAIAEGISNFHKRHKELYGFSYEDYPVEFMNFGLAVTGKMPRITLKKIKSGTEKASAAVKDQRQAYFEEYKGYVKTKIYDGDKLLAGNTIKGPAIIEEKMTTIVVPPAFGLKVDAYGNYITV